MAYYSYDFGSRYTTTECNPFEINTYPSLPYNTGPVYNYGEHPCTSQDSFDSYSNTYYPGWQDYPNPNEYECGWQEHSFSTYEQEAPTTNHDSENSGMSLEEMVQHIASNMQLFSSQQQETQAQIQSLKDQICEYVSSQSRWDEDDKNKETTAPVSQCCNFKGGDVEQKPVVVPPPFSNIKEEDYINTWETFPTQEEPMVDDMKVFPSDGPFADPQKISSNGKGSILEIRADFKAPQHRVKTHVWDFDLLDPG